MEQYNWTDNPTECLVAQCNPDILNECLMHLKYNNVKDSIPLFTAITFDHILTGDEAIGWALQGSLVSNTYADAVNLIKELYENGYDETYRGIVCKKSTDGRYIADISQKDSIDELYRTTGIADFYILDSVNECFYLPRNDWFTQLTTDPLKVNEMVEAGLPDHNHTYNMKATTGGYAGGGDPQNLGITAFQTGLASLSNPIYGNSDSVQPPSSYKLLYYKVGNVVVNEGLIDVGNVLSDLQLKVDVDMSNVNNSGTEFIAHQSMPSNTYVNLTFVNSSIYVAPADGYFYLVRSTGANLLEYALLHNQDNEMVAFDSIAAANSGIYVFLPVKKGARVGAGATASGSSSNDKFRFIYAVGSESEAS